MNENKTTIPGPREAAQLIWYHLAHVPMVSDEDRAKLNAYAHDIYDRAATKPEPTTEPWTLIPEGRENAAVLRVNGVVGTYYADAGEVLSTDPDGDERTVAWTTQITSVVPVQVVPEGARVLGEDEIAVPRELVERAREWAGPVMESAVPRTEVTGIVRDLAAVKGGEGQ